MKIQIYKTLDRPTLSEGSESWTVRPNDGKRLVSRNVFHEENCTLLDHKRNKITIDSFHK